LSLVSLFYKAHAAVILLLFVKEKRPRRGITLVELVIAVALLLGVSVGGYRIFKNMQMYNSANDAQADAYRAVTNLKSVLLGLKGATTAKTDNGNKTFYGAYIQRSGSTDIVKTINVTTSCVPLKASAQLKTSFSKCPSAPCLDYSAKSCIDCNQDQIPVISIVSKEGADETAANATTGKTQYFPSSAANNGNVQATQAAGIGACFTYDSTAGILQVDTFTGYVSLSKKLLIEQRSNLIVPDILTNGFEIVR
jgi:Tfp pilus assembly protein PilV